MKKLLLFDIDSTLITMKRTAQRAIMSHASQCAFGYDIPVESIPSLSGKTDKQIIAEINVNLGLSTSMLELTTQKFLKGLRESTPQFSTRHTVQALDGAKEIVEYFHNHTDIELGLVTGNNRECAYFKLAPLGLDKYFRFGGFGCDHYDRSKLPPIAIKRANHEHPTAKFSSKNALIIGDAPGDIACAKANAIPVLAVATGHYSHQELTVLGADAVLDNFKDIEHTITIINNLLESHHLSNVAWE